MKGEDYLAELSGKVDEATESAEVAYLEYLVAEVLANSARQHFVRESYRMAEQAGAGHLYGDLERLLAKLQRLARDLASRMEEVGACTVRRR